jgi:hypothetical protein
MSGVSSVFGWCDVRDTEDKNSGYWLCECKTMTPDDPNDKEYTIKIEWLQKLLTRSEESNKMPILAFTLFGEIHKFIAMPERLLHIFEQQCEYINPHYDDIMLKRKSKNHKNYIIKKSYIMDRRFRGIRQSKLYTIFWRFGFEDEADGSGWVIMHLNDFVRFYRDNCVDLAHKTFYGIHK